MMSVFDHDPDPLHGPFRRLSNCFSTKRGPSSPPSDQLLIDAVSSVFLRVLVRMHSRGHTTERPKKGVRFRLFAD